MLASLKSRRLGRSARHFSTPFDFDPRVNYYGILGVKEDANDQDIKKAFYALAKRHHPDAASDSRKESDEKFKDISNAYDVLSDPEKRSQYDEMRGVGKRQEEETYTYDGSGGRRKRSYESWHRPNDWDYTEDQR